MKKIRTGITSPYYFVSTDVKMPKIRRLLMNRKLFNVFLVTAGAVIGSVVTWKVVKTYYEKITQEEIDSVREEYQNIKAKLLEGHCNDTLANESEEENVAEIVLEVNEPVEENTDDDEAMLIEYHKISSTYRSSEDTDDEDNNDEEGGSEESEEAPYINGPYVISPDDFRCSPPGYNAQALDYFSDGVLADSWGNVLDIDETIGEDSLEHFGEYVDDIVYVRNERLEIDYEVTCDLREYGAVYDTPTNR